MKFYYIVFDASKIKLELPGMEDKAVTSRPKCDVTKSWKKDREHATEDFINQEHVNLKVGNGGENNKKRKEFEDENETGSDEKRLKMASK